LFYKLEATVIKYVDWLISAVNPRNEIKEYIIPETHPCSVDYTSVPDKDWYYDELLNCCQRHVCRPTGYCKSIKTGACRFNFPKSNTIEKSYIKFSETNSRVKAEIILKRNDDFLNQHNRYLLENWQANIDIQIIIDKQAAINYLVKYVAKGVILC
jgi:hypothetical protein